MDSIFSLFTMKVKQSKVLARACGFSVPRFTEASRSITYFQSREVLKWNFLTLTSEVWMWQVDRHLQEKAVLDIFIQIK